ncbi:hypothetical protein ABTK34_19880, partial [Acinetobacter baumannii]
TTKYLADCVLWGTNGDTPSLGILAITTAPLALEKTSKLGTATELKPIFTKRKLQVVSVGIVKTSLVTSAFTAVLVS